MSRTTVAAWALAGACCTVLSATAQAQAFSSPNSAATLTVRYTIKGSGVDLPASHERNITWTVENAYEVKATMTAQKPGPAAGISGADAAEQANMKDRQAAAGRAAANNADMMAQAQKIAGQCGDDQACMTREVMKMSKGIDPNSDRMKATKADMAIATAPMKDRYQVFSPDKQSGTARIDEKSHEAYFDAACSLATEARCAIDSVVKGDGAQSDGQGHASFGTGAFAEYDAQNGALTLMLPSTGIANAERTVKSASAQRKSGTSPVTRNARIPDKTTVKVNCGPCKSASGSLSLPVKDQLLGRPATMTVEWRFERT